MRSEKGTGESSMLAEEITDELTVETEINGLMRIVAIETNILGDPDLHRRLCLSILVEGDAGVTVTAARIAVLPAAVAPDLRLGERADVAAAVVAVVDLQVAVVVAILAKVKIELHQYVINYN